MGKIEEIESVRGIAAMMVVLFHIPKWNAFLGHRLINNGDVMVDLFFVLSGFVIFSAYGERIKTLNDLAVFQFLRFGRLYPVHLLFLLVYLGIECVRYLAMARLGITPVNGAPFTTNDLDAFIKNLLLVQGVLPDQPLTFNAPAWSISVEFFAYLAFGGVALAFGRAARSVMAGVATVALILLATGLDGGFTPLLRCLAGFFVGCMTAQWIEVTKLRVPAWASVVAMAGIIAFLAVKPEDDFSVGIYFLTAALIATLMLAPDGAVNRALRVRPLVWLGTVSYSVYMSHSAIIWFVNQVLRVALKRPDAIVNGTSVTVLSTDEAASAVAAIIAAVLMISWATYSWIEAPMRDRSRKFADRRIRRTTRLRPA